MLRKIGWSEKPPEYLEVSHVICDKTPFDATRNMILVKSTGKSFPVNCLLQLSAILSDKLKSNKIKLTTVGVYYKGTTPVDVN